MLAEVRLDLQGGAIAGATLEVLAAGALLPFDVGVCPEVYPQMAHLNVLEGGEVSATGSLMLEDIGPLLQNVIVMVVVTDIQVLGGTPIVLQGATGAPELLQDTEAEEAGQEAGVCPEALHIAAAVTAAALSIAVHQPTPLDTAHLLAQKDGLLLAVARARARAEAGAGAGAHQRRGPLEAPHLQEELATPGQGPGRLLAAPREKRG